MRSRLFIAFSIVILITLAGVGYWMQKNTFEEINQFAKRGGFFGMEKVADSLENYYLKKGSWDGIFNYIGSNESDIPLQMPGKMFNRQGGNSNQGGMMNNNNDQRKDVFAIADADGVILVGQYALGIDQLTDEQKELTIPLYYQKDLIGYLIPPGTYFPNYDYIDTLGENIRQASYFSFGFAGILALAFALGLGYMLSKPINTLDQAASKMASGDYSQRVEIKGSPELKSLGETFNNLAESIQQHRASRTALTADIAHELRTPLAIQRANLEAIQDGIYPLDQESLNVVLQQNNMLSKLVEDLRTLAQSDEQELTLSLEESNISSLIRNSFDAFHAQAEKRKIDLIFEEVENLPLIPIDNYRFQQVMNNLLQNALRYTPDSGEIKILIERTKENINVRIIDSGSGIPPSSINNVFKRFYRADESRSREYGGTGLGLTIAKRLIEAHGGILTASNHPEAGAEFKITLPIEK